MDEDKYITFQKRLSELKKFSKIEECFYHDKTQCKGKIKLSHSIQKNGRLSILEEEINGNKLIYSFTSIVPSKQYMIQTLEPIGKAKASTFFGFCDYHDSTLFSIIENHPFDNSDKHCFLHSYRAFAHSYHYKNEEYKSLPLLLKDLPQDLRFLRDFATKMGVDDMNFYKKKIDSLIEKDDYSGLQYFTYILPDLYPIACSSTITPDYTYNGSAMNNHLDSNIKFSPIMITVLPDFNQTIIILSCFSNDNKAEQFIDELEVLNDYKLKKAISSLLISYAENTFFSPKLWNGLGKKGQQLLCREIESKIRQSSRAFPHVKINFFEDKFSTKRLSNNNIC